MRGFIVLRSAVSLQSISTEPGATENREQVVPGAFALSRGLAAMGTGCHCNNGLNQ